MQQLNTIVDQVEKTEFCKGLMYIRRSMNGNLVMDLVDSGAAHNFIRILTTKKFSLRLSPFDCTMKTMNAEALSSHGEAKCATLWVDY